jgi:carbamate kinase
MRLVAALGGNALLRRGERPDALIQQHHIADAARALAPLAREHELIVTHGNGPQVGLLAVESEDDASLSAPYPLDALGAQTQGMIGYWLALELEAALAGLEVVSLITRVEVDPDDPAFEEPVKFIGPGYDEPTATRLAAARGWSVALDGERWRRVVASPAPLRIVEAEHIAELLRPGRVIVCAGGGGVPVVRDRAGALRGVEAVVDKDAASCLLAETVRAEALLLLTDVDAVIADWGSPSAHPIGRTTPDALSSMSFASGSMGPKVAAACRFASSTGKLSAIGSLEQAGELLVGRAGTSVVAGSPA